MPQVYLYKVTNVVNNKSYIGQTVQPVNRRWSSHVQCARSGKDLYFYHAIRKYGADRFTVETIDVATDKPQADELERKYIIQFNTVHRDHGYNMTYGGHGSPHLPEVKAKIGDRSREWWANPENKERASASRRGLLSGSRNPRYGHTEGRPHSEETKRNLSEIRKELYRDPEFKSRMSEANTGKHHTDSGRENIRKAVTGNHYRLGTKQSPEARKNISDGLKRFHERKKLEKCSA